MASYRRRGKTWTAYWYEADSSTGERRQRSKGGFRTRTDAAAWHQRHQDDRRRGYNDSLDIVTVTEFVQLYIDSRTPGRPSDGTLANYRVQLKNYIAPFIGTMPVNDLTKQAIQRWHRQLMEYPVHGGKRSGLAPRTIRSVHTLLSAAFNEALNDGLIHRNPCRGATPPKAPRSNRKRLTAEETRLLLAATDTHERIGLLFRLGLFTLMRPGELMALQWDDIDWKRNTIRVDATRTYDSQFRQILGERAKTESSHRTIAVTDDVMARLRAHRHKQIEHRLEYAELWHDHDYIFCRKDGRMLGQRTLVNTLDRLCAQAGVPRITPHELRHTGASLMVENNEHLKVISERLGHSSIAVTADVYLSVSEGMQREASERMERLFRGA